MKQTGKRVCVYIRKEMLENFLVFEGPHFMNAHSDFDLCIHSINWFLQQPSGTKQHYHCFTDGMLSQA